MKILVNYFKLCSYLHQGFSISFTVGPNTILSRACGPHLLLDLYSDIGFAYFPHLKAFLGTTGNASVEKRWWFLRYCLENQFTNLLEISSLFMWSQQSDHQFCNWVSEHKSVYIPWDLVNVIDSFWRNYVQNFRIISNRSNSLYLILTEGVYNLYVQISITSNELPDTPHIFGAWYIFISSLNVEIESIY